MLIGEAQVFPRGDSNYQVPNQLSVLSNEAVHLAELSLNNIDLHVKCTFDPDHPSTFIGSSKPPPRAVVIAP